MRFWLGKLIGFLAGMLLGIALVLVPAVVHRLLNPSEWAREAHTLGPGMGFMYDLLGMTVFSIVVGLFFGLIGQAWGGRLQEAANQRSARLIAAAMQAEQAENVWPPPPTKGDTDDR